MAVAWIRSWLWAPTLFAACTSGLMSGVFFAFSNFLIKAFDSLTPAQAIAAMQSINIRVLNPLFMLVLFGPAICSVILGVAAFTLPLPATKLWLLAGCALYLLGVVVVTAACNVALNNGLAQFHSTEAEAAKEMWHSFRSSWSAWNHVRTIASLFASISFWMALNPLLKRA